MTRCSSVCIGELAVVVTMSFDVSVCYMCGGGVVQSDTVLPSLRLSRKIIIVWRVQPLQPLLTATPVPAI